MGCRLIQVRLTPLPLAAFLTQRKSTAITTLLSITTIFPAIRDIFQTPIIQPEAIRILAIRLTDGPARPLLPVIPLRDLDSQPVAGLEPCRA